MIRLLIVHDDPVTVDALRGAIFLRHPQAQIHVVSSMRDAVIKLLQVPYTALVTDVRAAGFDLALKVCRLLQPTAQTVVISSDQTADRRALAVRLGTDVVLQKPLERNVLMAWLDAVVQRGREPVRPDIEDFLYLKAMVHAVEALLFMTDPEWSILVFNRAAQAVSGYSANEVYGKNLLQLLVPPDWRRSLGDAFLSVARRPLRNPWLTKSGQLALIEWRYSTVDVADYRGPCIVGVGIPVSAQA